MKFPPFAFWVTRNNNKGIQYEIEYQKHSCLSPCPRESLMRVLNLTDFQCEKSALRSRWLYWWWMICLNLRSWIMNLYRLGIMSLTLSCISDVILVTKLVSITVGTLRSKIEICDSIWEGLTSSRRLSGRSESLRDWVFHLEAVCKSARRL